MASTRYSTDAERKKEDWNSIGNNSGPEPGSAADTFEIRLWTCPDPECQMIPQVNRKNVVSHITRTHPTQLELVPEMLTYPLSVHAGRKRKRDAHQPKPPNSRPRKRATTQRKAADEPGRKEGEATREDADGRVADIDSAHGGGRPSIRLGDVTELTASASAAAVASTAATHVSAATASVPTSAATAGTAGTAGTVGAKPVAAPAGWSIPAAALTPSDIAKYVMEKLSEERAEKRGLEKAAVTLRNLERAKKKQANDAQFLALKNRLATAQAKSAVAALRGAAAKQTLAPVDADLAILSALPPNSNRQSLGP
jgi:hypothetical protein